MSDPLVNERRSGILLAAASVRSLHSPRKFSGDGCSWTVCTECRQTWPCATEQILLGVLEAGSE